MRRLLASSRRLGAPASAAILLIAACAGRPVPAALPGEPARVVATAVSPLPAALAERLDRIAWTPERVRELIERMPKVETHLHLDGALSPATIRDLARRQGYAPLAEMSLDEIAELAVVRTPRQSLAEVLRAFEAIYPLLHDAAAIEQVAYAVLEAAAAQKVRHVEVRFAPALQATEELSIEQVLEAALGGLARGGRDFGVSSGVIVSLYRPLDRAANEAMLAAAIAFAGRGVVAIDLAGNEAKHPLSGFADLYRRARTAGLRTTVHAGEVPGSADLELALDLEVDRIGHAVGLAARPDLLAEVVRRRLPLEINPTSNLRTGAVERLADHPAAAWLRAGVPVTVSTDDPGVFGIDLVHEYRVLAEEMGLSPTELVAVSLHGVESLFLADDRKAALRAELEREVGELLAGWE